MGSEQGQLWVRRVDTSRHLAGFTHSRAKRNPTCGCRATISTQVLAVCQDRPPALDITANTRSLQQALETEFPKCCLCDRETPSGLQHKGPSPRVIGGPLWGSSKLPLPPSSPQNCPAGRLGGADDFSGCCLLGWGGGGASGKEPEGRRALLGAGPKLGKVVRPGNSLGAGEGDDQPFYHRHLRISPHCEHW